MELSRAQEVNEREDSSGERAKASGEDSHVMSGGTGEAS